MKQFICDKEFFELFPQATIGVLCLTGAEGKELTEAQNKEIEGLLEEANKKAEKYVPDEPISANEVVKVWREAYKQFPGKKGARCAIENLLKRVLKNNPVSSIHPSVDITNSISLKYAFPIGVEDCDTFDGDIRLGFMKGGEDFVPIGEDSQDPPKEGELAYYDNTGVICRNWNWRDGQRTQVTDDTKTSFVAMECIEPDRVDDLEKALDELANLFEKYMGAKIEAKALVDKDNPSAVLID